MGTVPQRHADARQPKVITHGNQDPTLVLGPERLHYQFSVSLPLIHLTFVSIVQGVAFSVLLQSLPVPTRQDGADLLKYVAAQHAYLPWLFSGLLIVVIWKQFVEATLFYLWPLSTIQVGLMLLIAVAEITGFREITHFTAWMTCMGLVGIVGGAIRLHNLLIKRECEYASEEFKRTDLRIDLVDGALYGFLGVIITCVGIYLHYDGHIDLVAAQWAVFVVLLLIMVGIVVLDHADTRRYIKGFAKGSDLVVTDSGGIRYSPHAPTATHDAAGGVAARPSGATVASNTQ